MYTNFDEKYVCINYDEGSSATLTQTTLAYWDSDYGKKVLTNDEQLNMYMKPKVSPAVKYLMYDNMLKLVDAKAFIRVEKIVDALNNVKYNFYTKRNVRYTILFPAQFIDINIKYMEDYENLYNKLESMLKIVEAENIGVSTDIATDKVSSEIVPGDDGKVVDVETIAEEKIETFDVSTSLPKIEINNFINDVKLEQTKAEAEEEYNEEEKIEFSDKPFDTPVKSKVVFNEDSENQDSHTDVDKGSLENILESLDLD